MAKIKVTWTVQGMDFEAVTDTIAGAYEYVKAIVKTEKSSFPNQEEALSEYMEVLAGFVSNGVIGHRDHILKIEKMERGEEE